VSDAPPGGGASGASGDGAGGAGAERPTRRNGRHGRGGRRGGRNRRGRAERTGPSRDAAAGAARDGGAPPPAAPVSVSPAAPSSASPSASPTKGGGRANGGQRQQRARREVSAGGVVFRVEAGGDGAARPLFLLIRDSYQNWGFPKGHLERGEQPDAAAMREVVEETGLDAVALRGAIETIDWYFRFRGRLIHKVCHFFLMETEGSETSPQVAEGITACRWAPFDEAVRLVSYANAREVLKRAHAMVGDGHQSPRPPLAAE
jgi:8-oxo-dGTP pyrophosphatase MutT (NUDIX family)